MKKSLQKTVEFEEPLFYYNDKTNLFEEKAEIQVLLETKACFKEKFDKKLPVLSIKSKSKNSQLRSQEIWISYEYEFHYYPKKTFKSEKDFKNAEISKSINIPDHVIVISKKEIDENHEILFFFDVFGCNCLSNCSKERISLTLAKLYYEVRYSNISIIHQIKQRLSTIIDKCFKDIVKYLCKFENFGQCTSIAEFLLSLLKKDVKYEENPEFLIEIENLVYKCIISEGLFPIYCEINTMNTNAIRLALSSLLIPDSILPWSPKFHASFCIADFHYSFNPNNRMNTKKMEDRAYKSNFFYVRIKILDFFPLDHWVKSIAKFFFENLSRIFNGIKEKNAGIFAEGTIHEDEFIEISKENTFLGDLWNKKTRESQDLNGIKEGLLKKNYLLGKFFSKSPKKNAEDSKKEEKVKSFRQVLKKELKISRDFKEIDNIIANISIEFYENYKFELTNTQILWNICKIIARTELKQYETLSNNCQTPVAESLHIIHEKLKQFIEPLQKKKDFKLNSKKTESEYFKFSSKITKLMNENKMIKPTVLDCNLDYFGIYSDKYLQRYLENVKKVRIFENFKKVNDKISFSEKKNEILFENFGNRFRAVFENIKENSLNEKLTFGVSNVEKPKNFEILKNYEEFEWKNSCYELKNYEKSLNCEKSLYFEKSLNFEKSSIFEKNSNLTLEKNRNSEEKNPKKKVKKQEKINRALSYFMFMCENIIYNYKIRISMDRESEENRQLIVKKYEMMSLYREFSYYYFNSIRLKNSYKLNKNNISYVGFIIIKDPGKLLLELPENSKEIYASAYM